MNHREWSCIIVGAGLAGLMAAQHLQENGVEALILERASATGGRMAASRFRLDGGETAVFDSGAQFFTLRDPHFGRLVAEWQAAGVVKEWCRGFADSEGIYQEDGYPRYRGAPDMTAVPQYLAQNLNVQLDTPVSAIRLLDKSWQLQTDSGRNLLAASLILTPPVPQALTLLEKGNVSLPVAARQALSHIRYEPCLALLAALPHSSRLPHPGAVHIGGEPIAWIADNHQKGISPQATAVTLHAGPQFSRHHWDSDDEQVSGLMLTAVQRWIGDAAPLWSRVYRWPYSRPAQTHPDPCLFIPLAAPLIFGGDAFAGPRIEGAALSGMAAAQQIVEIGRRA